MTIINVPHKRGVGRSEPLSPENLVNMFASVAPKNARSAVSIDGVPGKILRTAIGENPLRGLWAMDGILYAVSGPALYSISSAWVGTELGTINGANRVGMADNGTQLCIVNGPDGYIYTVSDGLEQITDPDFPGADTVAFLDGYFIFNNPNTGQFFISSSLDGTMYDAADFATAESFPDPLLAVFVDHRELLLFGSETVEVWFDAGLPDFPFARAQGASTEKGIGAKFTVAKVDNSVFWLDHEGVVRRMGQGYVPVRVSEHWVEYAIAQGDWSQAYAYSYSQEGHEFYAITVPDTGTFVYDAATQMWHEHKSYGRDFSRAGFYAFVYNTHVVGDVIAGNVYELDFDTHDEAGDPIIAEMIFSQLRADGKRFIVHLLELDMEVGVGLTTGQGSDPKAMMRISSDGGRTYSTSEKTASIGKIGEYEIRALWRQLSQYRSFTPKITIADPVRRAVYTAYAEIERCDS